MTEQDTQNTQPAPVVPEEPEPSSFRLISTLGLGGFFAGLALVAVYLYTLPLINANKAEALQKAIFQVLPGCARYDTYVLSGNTLQLFTGNQERQEGSNQDDLPRIYAGYDSLDRFIGFAIPGEEPGFQDVIGAILGYDPVKKEIIGFQVLECKETPGLGDKIYKDDQFQENFTALAVDPKILPVKRGEKTRPNEVETITGATISSKAVVRLLNKTMNSWRAAIDRFMESNQLGTKPENNE